MNHEKWAKHLIEQNRKLEKELIRLRTLHYKTRLRAELWRKRALRGKTKT